MLERHFLGCLNLWTKSLEFRLHKVSGNLEKKSRKIYTVYSKIHLSRNSNHMVGFQVKLFTLVMMLGQMICMWDVSQAASGLAAGLMNSSLQHHTPPLNIG